MPEPDRPSDELPSSILRFGPAGRSDGGDVPDGRADTAGGRTERGDVANRLGAGLRQVFDEVAAEPLPQAFEDLLRKLA